MRKLFGIGTVPAADHHAVLKQLSLIDQPLGKVGDGEAISADQLTELSLGITASRLKRR